MPKRITDNPVLNRMPRNDREQVQYTKELVQYLVAEFTDLLGRASLQQLPMQRIGGSGAVQNVDPLTSEASGSTADIDIAAHTVQVGTTFISYNGGSIMGLDPNTLYFVYADDPDYAGGAVAYYATEDRQEPAMEEGRYYVGSIWTARVEPNGNITSITQADPAYVTCNNTFKNGDQVDIAGVTGMTEVNGNRYTIHNVTATGFNLKDTDSTGYTAYTGPSGTATFVTQPTTGGGGGGGGGGGPGVSPVP